jgi:membrane protein implicated in regulation of membrane protease activity
MGRRPAPAGAFEADAMSPGIYEIVNGMCALIFSLLIWRITGNFWGWLVLFLPGSYLVFVGCWKVFKSD